MPRELRRRVSDTRNVRTVGIDDGVFHLGRPPWLDDDLFGGLRREAAAQRGGARHIRYQHFGELGPLAARLAISEVLHDFVTLCAGQVRYSGEGNYRYYDVADSRVPPHVDTAAFSANVLIMLEHEVRSELRSALLLFPTGPADPVTIDLRPGEVIVFNARDVIHARTPLSETGDERATNLGLGFERLGAQGGAHFWHPTGGWTDSLDPEGTQ